MSYKITISESTVLEKCIQDVRFNIAIPNDFNSRHTNNKNSIMIKGNIDTDESTAVLYNWALLSANDPSCYKKITVEQYKSEKLLKRVTLSKAFVVKYTESYTNEEEVGTFTLHIKQLYGQDIEVTREPSVSPTHNAESKDTKSVNEENLESVNRFQTGVDNRKLSDPSIESGNFVDYMDDSEAQRYREYWARIYKDYSPVKIPDNAKIKAEFKKAGYEQFQYKWNDGTYRWDVRWHTRTPNAPLNQGSTWVVKRETIGNGPVKPHSEFFLQGNQWIQGFKWYDAIKARKLGTATPQQVDILDKGHWPWPT